MIDAILLGLGVAVIAVLVCRFTIKAIARLKQPKLEDYTIIIEIDEPKDQIVSRLTQRYMERLNNKNR